MKDVIVSRSGLEDATAERPSPNQGAMATLRPYGRMQLR
jgi:hypothetical protein